MVEAQKDVDPEWKVEFLKRHKIIMLVYCDDEIRGQIELADEMEKVKWIKLIAGLNSLRS